MWDSIKIVKKNGRHNKNADNSPPTLYEVNVEASLLSPCTFNPRPPGCRAFDADAGTAGVMQVIAVSVTDCTTHSSPPTST